FDPAQLSAVLPRELPAAAFVRGYVDLRPLIEAGGPALRAIPVLRALGAAGYALGATPVELRGTVAADTAGAGLTGIDLPLLKRAAGTRPALPDHAPALAVADLSALAAAAERALRTALPVSALRLDALRARLRAAGVALNADLLAGPAEVIRTPRGPQLRLQPSHPAAVAQALARAARRLHGAHLRITRDGPLYVARDGKRVLLRLGLVNGSLVAGRAPAAALVALARQPLSSLHSPAVARLPRLADWYPRPVVLALGGSTRKLRVDVFSGF
ncbi:MAG: hypothetical protein QOI80_3293, partial [Solirubrobacteraceae bacterium]|nr:hypothetical protein [Solirubrobacteraceae bacterium]